MELLYAGCLLAVAISVACRFDRTPYGWAVAWSVLFLLAGLFRILIQWLPVAAPAISFGVTLVAAIWGLRTLKVPRQGRAWLFALPWLVGIVFLLMRSYFPQCDVDSMLYHVMSVRWLQDRHTLLALQRLPGVIHECVYLVGFEEFLSIPGLLGDLPLCAGLVGGVIKALGIFTLVSCVPRSCHILRYGVC